MTQAWAPMTAPHFRAAPRLPVPMAALLHQAPERVRGMELEPVLTRCQVVLAPMVVEQAVRVAALVMVPAAVLAAEQAALLVAAAVSKP
ncbi:hypothetical protein K5Q02_11795 [Pseudomonas sp. MM211]|uniref:hypothetical protein n=1 Tax=Pseudomonas sp. MM211 TaxID=2866808 RepID=UPI001CEC2CA6|nr:hypothetical protein [Pseudomonas sp. MM211]UCJ18992.1 hypothetical protein K5Q02_11795 [Pseudomonas sp. MM211]